MALEQLWSVEFVSKMSSEGGGVVVLEAKKILGGSKHFVLIFLLIFFISSCATSPTGRSQLHLISAAQMDKMGIAAYEDLKKKTPQSKNTKTNHYVRCIASAITREVRLNTQWEVTVFQDKAVNAFALPGGKIGVYTGLLDVTKNQHQLATVIAHEVAHVIAEHANARVSASLCDWCGFKACGGVSRCDNTRERTTCGFARGGCPIWCAHALWARPRK